MTDYCFDVTESLGERPVELAIGRESDNVVLCAVRKSTKRGMHVAAMWEVENGLHRRESVALLSVRAAQGHKLIDALFLLYGMDDTNLAKIKMQRRLFDAPAKFWEELQKLGIEDVVTRSRLSQKMQHKLITEAGRLGEERL